VDLGDSNLQPMPVMGHHLFEAPLQLDEPGDAKIGVALGGGFVRGIAHIGVLKVLEEENITIDFVAGSSAGALVGAIYCSGMSAREMEEQVWQGTFANYARSVMADSEDTAKLPMNVLLDGILPVQNFEELRIPLAVTATDFFTGEAVVLRTGSLADSVEASCAYPGMFPPVTLRGRLLVDGALVHPVPTHPLREAGCDRVLGVHLRGGMGEGEPGRVLDLAGMRPAPAHRDSRRRWRSCADLLVEPDVKSFTFDDFDRMANLVRAGEEAMRAALPRLASWFEPAVAFKSLTASREQ
jgi:NTE family protein